MVDLPWPTESGLSKDLFKQFRRICANISTQLLNGPENLSRQTLNQEFLSFKARHHFDSSKLGNFLIQSTNRVHRNFVPNTIYQTRNKPKLRQHL